MKRWLLILIPLLLLAGGVVAAAGFYWPRLGKAPAYRTAAVHRGELQLTISATGTVEPEEVVDVGAQVAGQIKSLGTDPRDPARGVDYTTPVDEGTVLARIDDTLHRADVDQAAAALDVAKAAEQRARADLDQLKAKLAQAENDWNRVQEIRKGSATSVALSEFDQYRATYLTAKSAVNVGEVAIVQAVAQAEAALQKAQRNLSYCTIRSPVKGVIIDRRVNVGQTVVSSLNAPSLFLIAKDLKRMQVWVAVNEADIGQIHPGQPVTFTVDAFPGVTFRGEVGKIRLNATMTQNVVTYTVEVNTDNSSGKLLPYLTANLQFEVGRREGVLLVPNAALRWVPQPQQVAPEHRDPAGGRGPRRGAKEAGDRGTVWVTAGEFVRPVRVRIGGSDGSVTEVDGEGLTEGTEVVVGEARQTAGGGGASNPFAPKMFGGGSKGQ